MMMRRSEAVNGPGDGNTEADWEVVPSDGTWNIWVRAERSGQGVGRVYTIEVQVTDASNNSSVRTFTVTVPHDRGKK